MELAEFQFLDNWQYINESDLPSELNMAYPSSENQKTYERQWQRIYDRANKLGWVDLGNKFDLDTALWGKPY